MPWLIGRSSSHAEIDKRQQSEHNNCINGISTVGQERATLPPAAGSRPDSGRAWHPDFVADSEGKAEPEDVPAIGAQAC